MEPKRPWQGHGSGGPQAKKPYLGASAHESLEDELDLEAGLGDDDEDQRILDEDLEIELGEAGRNWERNPVPAFDPQQEPLTFQQLEVDYFIGEPNAKWHATDLQEAPIIRMYGVNSTGNSVCAFVHGFEPYFYIEAPPHCGPDECDCIRNVLNARLAERTKGSRQQTKFCLKVVMEQKQTIMQYQPVKSRAFLRIVVATPNLVTQARAILEQGIPIESLGITRGFATYESNVLFVLRFMVDCSIVGGNWVEFPAGSYSRTPEDSPSRFSHCQIEVHCHYSTIICHPPEGEWGRLAPFRILSLDIECAGRKGHFPDAKQDPVIQIANMVTIQGESSPIVRNVMTLQSCAHIVGAEVMSFDNERDLLLRWRDLVIESDPDVIIGYNINNFDLPYLIDRAEALKVAEFPYWGRIRKSKLRMKDTVFSSKAHGTREYKDITIDGRVQFDLLTAVMRDHRLSSYSLNAVSAHFLGEQKEDVHHSIITDLQNGNAETRRRLAVYCLKDAYLPQRLVDKLMYMYNYVEMARVTGVPMSFLLTRGQSIKVFSQILRKARQRGLLVPNMKAQGPSTEQSYEGATVLEPKIGFYKKPVATLDFASLYPSIMMAHNLCYSTLIPRARRLLRLQELPPEDVVRTPAGDTFVKASRYKGILPEILEELLAARKRAKTDLKAATDPFVKAVLDGRQLALKISANSVYGFTGATVGKMPCLEISSSVTAFGREMIEHTKKLVMAKYTRANGYEADCDVIYGDTDSVMVNFSVSDIARAMELGKDAADYVSSTFVKPIKLEFEKVYNPYLLISKKRYAGLLWTNPDKWDKMDTKGIETVRRDNCLLVRNVVSTCLEKILMQKDEEGAKEYVRGIIGDLLMNRMDLSLLVVTKGLTKETYDNKQGHVELAKKMRERDAATAPTIGDRVPYVIIKGHKGAKAYEKAEDPIYALEHNLPIDCQHYLEHHLSLPLMRIFGPIMKNPKELLSGAHTRSILVATPSLAAGGIMRFTKVRLTCLGCRVPLAGDETTVCQHCSSKEAEIYEKALMTTNELEDQFAALWTQCQRCQGSLHQDVLCTSRDCPIFYRRKKVQKDLREAHSTMQRFTDW